MSLHLGLVVLCEQQRTGSGTSPKIVLHLSSSTLPETPVQVSECNHIKLSFRSGGMMDFSWKLENQLKRFDTVDAATNRPVSGKSQMRTGISGIEKHLQEQQLSAKTQISKAFEDLDSLIKMAKETVNLSKSLVTKVKNRTGEITDDETTQLKSYLLSLGVDDPVTRDVCGSDNVYHKKLAKEISDLMVKPLQESGGLMTLTDVYLHVNRARGFELVSPEDLLSACRQMAKLQLPTQIKTFDTGVMTLELRSLSEQDIVKRTRQALDGSPLTAEMLAKTLGVSVVLAKEMLLLTEKRGLACRDETMEGLRFFPNAFVHP